MQEDSRGRVSGREAFYNDFAKIVAASAAPVAEGGGVVGVGRSRTVLSAASHRPFTKSSSDNSMPRP